VCHGLVHVCACVLFLVTQVSGGCGRVVRAFGVGGGMQHELVHGQMRPSPMGEWMAPNAWRARRQEDGHSCIVEAVHGCRSAVGYK
jgi:hypothetical protein